MMQNTLTIFEGVDGSGKTTAAKAYADAIGAEYIHFSSYPEIVDNELARVYLRAFEPLMVERKHVVFDRCWISEVPYGTVYRDGLYRIHKNTQVELESIALMFNPIVVFCNPGLDQCLMNYRSRQHLEMLKDEEQLAQVYRLYLEQKTRIPCCAYDYTKSGNITPIHIATIRNHFYG